MGGASYSVGVNMIPSRRCIWESTQSTRRGQHTSPSRERIRQAWESNLGCPVRSVCLMHQVGACLRCPDARVGHLIVDNEISCKRERMTRGCSTCACIHIYETPTREDTRPKGTLDSLSLLVTLGQVSC